jgi:CCR4-NOT transcription complex subunit 1
MKMILFGKKHFCFPILKWQMDGALSDVILEMGYEFTGSVEDCRNALVHFGLQELKPSTIARMLSAMIKTHSGLNENTRIYESNGTEMVINNDKHSLQTWNMDTFVIAINDLVNQTEDLSCFFVINKRYL